MTKKMPDNEEILEDSIIPELEEEFQDDDFEDDEEEFEEETDEIIIDPNEIITELEEEAPLIGGIPGTRITGRMGNLSSWQSMQNAARDQIERELREFSNNRNITESNKAESKSTTKDDEMVPLYEEKNKKAMFKDVYYVHSLGGYFLKTDTRIFQDYFIPNRYLINDNRYSVPNKIYTNIDGKGKLCDEKYSLYRLSDIGDIRNINVVRVIESKDDYESRTSNYVTYELSQNEKFKDTYKELLADGNFYNRFDSFCAKLLSKNKLHNKILGRKYKSSNNFLKDCKKNNTPITYVNTFGKKYTFGIEIETIAGLIPQRLDNKLYYSAVHDGSLRHEDGNTYGLEYVTDVLKGDVGLKQLKMLCNELSKRCLINKKCGVHVHLGDANFSKENIVLMYYLYQKIEKEIYSMLPKSRRKNEYCRTLTYLNIDINEIQNDYKFNIEKYYQEIMKILARKDYNSKHVNKKNDHPDGFKCGYNHSSARYCWVNFIPAVFDTRKAGIYTIEFRPAAGSMSYTKIKNWLMICMGLMDVIENHKQEILAGKINTLDDILFISYPKDYQHLVDYVKLRKDKFNDVVMLSEDAEEIDYTENEIDNNISFKKL